MDKNEKLVDAQYGLIYQNNATNLLSCIPKKFVDKFIAQGFGDSEIRASKRSYKGVQYWIVPRKVNLVGSTGQMFDYIVKQFTSNVYRDATPEQIMINRELEININDVAKKFGMSMKGARKMVVRTVNSLSNIKIDRLDIPERSQYVKNRADAIKWSFPIVSAIGVFLDDKTIKNSKMRIVLHEKFVEMLPGANLMWYPENLLKIDTSRYPYAYMFGRKMVLNTRQNRNKKNGNYLNVSTLLALAQGLPMYSKIKDRGRIKEKIIQPFCRNIDILITRGILDSWYLQNKFKQIVNPMFVKYDEFIQCEVHYKLKNYPCDKEKFNDVDIVDDEDSMLDTEPVSLSNAEIEV